jgi:hypothetical protein
MQAGGVLVMIVLAVVLLAGLLAACALWGGATWRERDR